MRGDLPNAAYVVGDGTAKISVRADGRLLSPPLWQWTCVCDGDSGAWADAIILDKIIC